MERKRESEEEKQNIKLESSSLTNVFPSGKVKGQLLTNKEVGKLKKDAVELIGE